MRRTNTLITLLVLCAGMLLSCKPKRSFSVFLCEEISSLGGITNQTGQEMELSGSWTVKHDQSKTTIVTDGIPLREITNFLTSAYGVPAYICYLAETNDGSHGVFYKYPLTNAGIDIFVVGTARHAEITLAKPLKF